MARRNRDRFLRAPLMACEAHVGPVHHDRRAHVRRARSELCRGRLLRDPRLCRQRLRDPLSTADLPRLRAVRLAHGRVRGREGHQQPGDVARGGARLPDRPSCRPTGALAARSGACGRASVARLHGDRDDGESLLPARAPRHLGDATRSRPTHVADVRARARDARTGVRDAHTSGRARGRDRVRTRRARRPRGQPDRPASAHPGASTRCSPARWCSFWPHRSLRGQSVRELLGAYNVIGDGSYDRARFCATGSGTPRT